MKRSLCLATLGILSACTDSAPVISTGPGLPDLSRPRGSIQSRPSMETGIARSEVPSECAAWVTEIETYDEATGDYEYLQTCAVGGDIASVHTVGHDDAAAGTGSYSVTYGLRDGSTVVWTVDYHANPDGTVTYAGTSTDGATMVATYGAGAGGSTLADESWTYPGIGTYEVDGTYFDDGRFDGTITFDDPSTAASPDWTIIEHDALDGTISQTYLYEASGWEAEETYVQRTDGSLSISFGYDDPSTIVTPDTTGGYTYAASGDGTGSYQQSYDDGGRLDVSHVIEASGAYSESWTYADADSSVAVDQEGSASYAADGSGGGSYTNHLADGSSVTCTFSVAADGTVTMPPCT